MAGGTTRGDGTGRSGWGRWVTLARRPAAPRPDRRPRSGTMTHEHIRHDDADKQGAEGTVDASEALPARVAAARAHPHPPVPAARWIAWSLWAITAAQIACGLVLAVLNGPSLHRLVAEFFVSAAIAALAFTTVGVLIVRRYPAHTVGWLFCAAGVGNGLFPWSTEYARYALVTQPGALPGGAVAHWLNLWAWVPVEATVVLFLPLLFPDGRLPSARWRPLACLAAGATAALSLSLALGPKNDAVLPGLENPFALADAEGILHMLGTLGNGLMLISLLGALAAAVVRFRRARGVERQQFKWVGFGVTLLIVAYVGTATIYLSGIAPSGLPNGVLLALALPCLPITTGIAILRHCLYDIDVLIHRTLVYGALTAGVVGLYIVVVAYLGALFRTGDHLAISLIATGLVAVLFQPLREGLQRGVNRLLYGERDDPYAVLSRLGQRLEATLAPEAALAAVVDTVAGALKLPHAAIWLVDGDTLRLAAVHGRGPAPDTIRDAGAIVALGEAAGDLDRQGFDPAGEFGAALAEGGMALALPLQHHGALVGALCLAPRGPGEAFSPADHRLLRDVAGHAGAAAQAVRLTAALRASLAELRRSRERLVVAQEEERRRIQRDLHDGLGPTLASMRVRLEGCLDEAQVAAPGLVADLERLDGLVGQATADIRRLVYDLRPPALDQLGLVPALRQHVERFARETGLTVRFMAAPDLAVPAATEVAVFRVVQEALVNVQKHARASRVEIRLDREGDWLTLTIRDDGRGLAPDGAGGAGAGTGTGLGSMRERAELLGGTLEVASRPGGGTDVVMRVAAVGQEGTRR